MSEIANRTYKDSVFCLLFNDKARLIELYNALFDTDYDMETPLDIDTIEDVFFVNMKNDIAFTIDNQYIVLTEHQPTLNHNMPLRELVYYTSILQKKLIRENCTAALWLKYRARNLWFFTTVFRICLLTGKCVWKILILADF